MPPDIEKVIQRNEDLKSLKFPWLPLYQSLAMYVFLRKQYFTIEYLKTPFMLNLIYDSTAPHAAHMMAASLLGQILPNPYESFEFVPQVAQKGPIPQETYDMFENINQVMPHVLSMPEAGLANSMLECVTDAGVFGIGSVVVDEQEDYAVPVRYYSSDAKVMNIDENQYGKVDTVYLEKTMRVVQIVDKYGFDNCSLQIQALYKARKFDEERKVLQAIEPRRERNPMKFGSMDMPFQSVHLELETKHVLKESGYNEMPIVVTRFWKNVNETQGRSPAMDALCDIRAVNRLVELFEKAGEMGLDPPRMLSSEDVLGAGKIPWGPGVEIPLHFNSRLGTDRMKPIEIIQTIENPSWAIQRIGDLRQNIKEYFLIEQLTDLNNTSRQTLGEANIRNEKSMFITGSVLNRFLSELLGPILDRTFNILLAKGFFGVVKGSMQDFRLRKQGIQPKYISQDFIDYRMQGLKGYRINFTSPAARLMKSEEAQGLADLLQFTMQLGQFKPNAWDNINEDKFVRERQKLDGASSSVLNSPEEVDQIRQARAQQQQRAEQQQGQIAQAHALKLAGAGMKDLVDANTNATNPASAAA